MNDVSVTGMMSALREWRQRIENDVSVLRMMSAYQEWCQRIKNDVSVFGLLLFRCQFGVDSMSNPVELMTFGPITVVLSRAADRFLLPSARLIVLEFNRIVWMLMIQWVRQVNEFTGLTKAMVAVVSNLIFCLMFLFWICLLMDFCANNFFY